MLVAPMQNTSGTGTQPPGLQSATLSHLLQEKTFPNVSIWPTGT